MYSISYDKNPLVSIIIPVFNTRAYLPQALNSVITQTYVNLEIIIVDDGSTDGCSSICDKYAEMDKRVIVFHIKNSGLSAARNYGLDHINNDSRYIAFLDSDDWYEKDAIELLMEEAIKSDADIVSCKYMFEYRNTNQPNSFHDQKDSIVFSDSEILNAFYSGKHFGSVAWNKLYKRELFKDIRYPEGRYFEDIAVTYRLLTRANRATDLYSVLVHYRMRASSIAHSYNLDILNDYWWAYHKQYEEVSILSNDYSEILLNQCMSAIGRMWIWYSGFSKEDKSNAKELLATMQAFSDTHRKEVIESSRISIINKVWCVCSKYKNPFIMRMLYLTNLLYRSSNPNKRLFE